MAKNKITDSSGKVLFDLTQDTVSPSMVVSGCTFHDSTGSVCVGELTPPSGSIAISGFDPVDVSSYETAYLSVANLDASNIKGGVSIYGVEGSLEYDRGVDYLLGNLTSFVDYKNAIYNLNEYTFAGFSQLTTVDLPVCSAIGSSAFQGCSRLTSVSIPNVTSISGSAFAQCTGLRQIDLPECLSMGGSVFTGCNSLSSISLPKATHVWGLNNCGIKSIDLPEVVQIGQATFSGCTSLTTVSIPKCQRIYDSAFYNCYNLSSIGGEQVTGLGFSTFRGCTRLANVNFPNAEYVPGYCFSGCTSLTSLSMPFCGSIGSGAFYNCKNLSQLYVPFCTSINSYAFTSCSKLDTVYLGFINMGSAVFSGAKIKTIVIPSHASVNYSTVTWASISYLDPEVDKKYIFPYEFCGGWGARPYPWGSYPKSEYVERIGSYAFSGVYGLGDLAFPECEIVYGGAFTSCGISTISLPKCRIIGGNAFYSGQLRSIYAPICSSIGGRAFQYCSYLSSVNLDSCEYIGEYAFYSCYNLTSVVLPQCRVISSSAFDACTKLSYLSVGSLFSSLGSPFVSVSSNFTFVIDEDNPYLCCDSHFIFSKSTGNDHHTLLAYFGSLPSVVSLSGVRVIGADAFARAAITQLDLPDCREIRARGLEFASITKLSIPLCESLQYMALGYNGSLSFCYLPKCSYIGDNCFAYCSSLKSLYLLSTAVPYRTSYQYDRGFYGTPIAVSEAGEYGSIFVRASLVSDFKGHPGWFRYSERIVGMTDEQIAALEEELDYA